MQRGKQQGGWEDEERPDEFWLQSVGRLWSRIDEEQQVYKTLCVLLHSCSTFSGLRTIFKGASREQGIEQVANTKRVDSNSTEGCTAASPAHSSAGCARGRHGDSRCPTGNQLTWQTLQFGQEHMVLQVLPTQVVQLSFPLRISKVLKSGIFTLGTPQKYWAIAAGTKH